MPVTRRNLLFLLTPSGFCKERNILYLSATPVDAHHKTCAGKQHQKGEGNGQYGTQ